MGEIQKFSTLIYLKNMPKRKHKHKKNTLQFLFLVHSYISVGQTRLIQLEILIWQNLRNTRNNTLLSSCLATCPVLLLYMYSFLFLFFYICFKEGKFSDIALCFLPLCININSWYNKVTFSCKLDPLSINLGLRFFEYIYMYINSLRKVRKETVLRAL